MVGLCEIGRPEGRIACALAAVNVTELGAGVLSIREGRRSLEDVYLEIVDKGVGAGKR